MRWGTAAFVALGLLASGVPGASAAGAVNVAVVGTVTLSSGAAAPCTGVGTCPPTVIPTPPPTGKLAPLFIVDGGLRTATFTSATCLDPLPCTMTWTFGYRGYCGLASGRGTGFVTSAGVTHLVDLTYVLIGTNMVVRGNAQRGGGGGEIGDVNGTAVVVAPVADCLAHTATTLTLAGDLAITYPKVL